MPYDTTYVPETVASSSNAGVDRNGRGYNEEEYQALRQRYLEKRVRTNEELPGGRVLRRQTQPAIIDTNTPAYKALKKRIAKFQKENNDDAIYSLLKRLADFEVKRASFPVESIQTQGAYGELQAGELIDLTNQDDEDIIDVETFIIDILLLKVVKADSDESRENTTEPNESGEGVNESIRSDTDPPAKRPRRIKQEDNTVTQVVEDSEMAAVQNVETQVVGESLDQKQEKKVPRKSHNDDKSKANDRKPSARENKMDQESHGRVLVEFLFRSHKTQLFETEGAFQGKLHVEMDQHPESGIYTIPVGQTQFRVYLDELKTESWCMGKECREFSGSFSRSSVDGPIEMDPGLMLDYYTTDHDNFRAMARPSHVGEEYSTLKGIKQAGSETFVGRNLSKWEKEQGGLLEVVASVSTKWRNDDSQQRSISTTLRYYGCSATGKYKITLYTVLSAYMPNKDSLPEYSLEQSPDWSALVRVVAARFPDQSESWVKRAVRQYRYFVDLKVDARLAKQQFSPSLEIDKIWHAHLSFTKRYQCDMLLLTQGNGIVEHNPMSFELSAKFYRKAHDEHSKRMAELNITVDREFWPKPRPYQPSKHEDSSGDVKMVWKTDRVIRGFGCG